MTSQSNEDTSGTRTSKALRKKVAAVGRNRKKAGRAGGKTASRLTPPTSARQGLRNLQGRAGRQQPLTGYLPPAEEEQEEEEEEEEEVRGRS